MTRRGRIVLAHRANVPYARRIIYEADQANLPVALGFALVEQESGFRNVFGCDAGGPFCEQDVTRARVQFLIAHVKAGGTSDGVGLTQLTSLSYIEAAERLGGAEKPKNQLRIGFHLLADNIHRYGEVAGIDAYNGDTTGHYAAAVIALRHEWHQRLRLP